MFVERTGCDDALADGDGPALCCVRRDHSVIRLRALHVEHRRLRAWNVGLHHQAVVLQSGHHHLKVDQQFGFGVAPPQREAAGGDVGDVQLVGVWRVETENVR